MTKPNFTRQLADLWAEILRTKANRIFLDDADLLRGEAKDDRTPQPGYVGCRYRPGGLLFIAKNPGGREGSRCCSGPVNRGLRRYCRLPRRRSLRVSRGQGPGVRMAGASAPAARRRPGLHAVRSVPCEAPRGPALDRVRAHDGPGRRSIEMSAPNGNVNA
jgi:hypothetical protein